MPYKNFMAFSYIFKFWVEMLWAFSRTCYVVAGPLTCEREGGNVVKEILVLFAGGGRLVGKAGGRATPMKTKVFDSTMGFPGEDVATQLQYRTLSFPLI